MDVERVRASDHGDRTSAMFAVDCTRTILAWNTGCEALLGHPAASAIGRKCHELIAGRLKSGKRVCGASCRPLERARRPGGAADVDLVVSDGRGRRQVLKCSTILLPESAGACAVHCLRPATTAADRDRSASLTVSPNLSHVTRRELEVLRALAAGSSAAEIAASFHVSLLTVRTHIRNLLRKCNLRRQTQLAVLAVKNGLH